MPRKQTISLSQLKVGIVVTAALAILLFTTIYITREGGFPLFGGVYAVSSYLGDVAGLKRGAPVHLSGVEVGSVSGVEFAPPGSPGPVKVSLQIRREVQDRVTTKSLVTVGSLGVLGEKMVDIEPGPPGGAPVPDGGVVPGEAEGDPIKGLIGDSSEAMADIRRLIGDVQQGKGTIGALLKDEELHARLVDVMGRAQTLLRKMNESEGTLGKALNDPAIYDNVNALSVSMKGLLERIEKGEGALGRLVAEEELGDSLSQTIKNLDALTQRMATGDGTVATLINERELYDRLNTLSGNLESITARLDRGEGTAGRLLQDRELYENLNAAITELRGLFEEIRKDPRKYLRVRVSIF